MFEQYDEAERFFASRKLLGIKPGLERIRKLLQLVDNPQDKLRAVHVAGTNGKGSTVNFISHGFMANGYQVGVFTSPSLAGLPGHILLNNQPIAEEAFLQCLNELLPAIRHLDAEDSAPTEFEILTALAILYFSRYTDIALIEAGMGGREDTTNCFVPILSIITNIAKDHSSFLGETTSEIASHKAGIIKPDVPVIAGKMDKEARDVVEQEAKRQEAVCWQLGSDVYFQQTGRGRAIWGAIGYPKQELVIGMQGEHQLHNASLAYMALTLLKEQGLRLNMELVRASFRRAVLPGRFEMLKQQPLVIADGAHNPAGIEAFIKAVKEHYPEKEHHVIFAAFADKELDPMLAALSRNFSSVTLTTFDHPRAASAEELYQRTPGQRKYAVSDWREAIKQTICHPQHGYFLTGSLHFLARVRSLFF
ncbi:bifunctional folylpolyglutamate synthase/dihydrofolate synthase [Lentibacillus sediminis]|uniref:bifunctional folylpolyglutamate synthase/dihydrofolate synthase n=1 Tax=Lentibacillus sediminis TaxID=1940529 RepID=UPI000C1BF751|nr:folylpolyglutamate synthase/dihydrofolate synthase family protein [Lentibacillus sediminis]